MPQANRLLTFIAAGSALVNIASSNLAMAQDNAPHEPAGSVPEFCRLTHQDFLNQMAEELGLNIGAFKHSRGDELAEQFTDIFKKYCPDNTPPPLDEAGLDSCGAVYKEYTNYAAYLNPRTYSPEQIASYIDDLHITLERLRTINQDLGCKNGIVPPGVLTP